MSSKLNELFYFCGKHDIHFMYEIDGDEISENTIRHTIDGDIREVVIKLTNPEDENLDSLIDEKIKELSLIVL